MKYYRIEVEETKTRKTKSQLIRKNSFPEAVSRAYELSHSFGAPRSWRVTSIVELAQTEENVEKDSTKA